MPNHNLLHSLLVTDMVHWVHYTDNYGANNKAVVGYMYIIILYNHTWLITHVSDYTFSGNTKYFHFPKYLVGRAE